jgi:CheY-like chemotaxis protein
VLGIVREHGGHVEVFSPPGGGATFTLEFPPAAEQKNLYSSASQSVQNGPELAPVSKALLSRISSTELAAWSGAQVLVIEDEPTVARLIGDVLEDAGLRVDILLDAKEALTRATAKSYALVICDVRMPEIDGPQIYQALVRQAGAFQGKFLFITGDAAAARTHDFLEQYHLPHLPKPFRVEELIEKVLDVLMKTSV